jgi:hypothetical protein
VLARPSRDRSRSLRDWWPILLLPAFVAAYASLSLSGTIVDDLIEEDGVYEWAGTLGLLAAAICLAVAAVRTRRERDGAERPLKPFVLGGLGLALFFAAGEEISWGQRLLGVETPDGVKEASGQDEINIHNLEVVGNTLDMGFQLFWAGLFVAVPLLAWLSPRARDLLRRYLPVAPPVIAFLLIANYLLAQISERALDGDVYDSKYPVVHSVNELKEAVVGVTLGVAAFLVLRALAARRGGPAADRA